MPKKLTIGFVRKQFENNNCILVSMEYEGAHRKLDYICPKGHRHSITWAIWQQGHRCPYCASNAKKTIEFIKSEFEKEEYVFLTAKYIGCGQKLKYMCLNGHHHSITWGHWQQGRRCPYCSHKKRKTIRFIKEEFKKEGYTLLTKKYKNAFQKLDYICPVGHKHSITWNDWQRGSRCPTCKAINMSGVSNWNWKGGISKEPYCFEFTNGLKEFVKQRDGYKCMNPCCNFKNPDDLCVHHFAYDKKKCNPEDLITVCRSCNAIANFDREWHTMWYRAIMYRRYGIK